MNTPPPCPVLLGQPDRTQLCFKTNRLDYEVYAGSPAEVVRAYSARAGRPALPPRRQLELTYWRDINPGGQQQVLDDIAQLQSRGIPVKTVWIDNPWEINTATGEPTHGGACNGTLEFDPEQFPDPQGMIDELHRRGVHLGLWISSFVRPVAGGVTCPDPGYPAGSYVADTGRTDRFDIDFTNPAAKAHFESKLKKLFRMGVDFVKGDRGDETDFENANFAAGPGREFHNIYPKLYAESTSNALSEVWGNDYTMVFRAGYTGSPSVLHGFWGADPNSTFEGLRLSVRRGLNSWLRDIRCGAPTPAATRRPATRRPRPRHCSPGGHSSPRCHRCSRSAARAATPRRGCTTRRRWPFQRRGGAAQRAGAVPVLAGPAASRTGEPITRPLGFAFPRDESAWAADLQMMVGPQLLAVPVTADRAETDGAAGQPTPVDVYLPRGRWLDLFSGEIVTGGRHLVRESTMDEFPLYLRLDSRAGAPDGDNVHRAGAVVARVNPSRYCRAVVPLPVSKRCGPRDHRSRVC